MSSIKSSAMDDVSSQCDESSRSESSCISRYENSTSSKIASSASVSSIASFPEYDLKTTISLTDLKNKLSELIKSKGPDLIQACKNFDRRSTGKIPKTQLRQVMRMFCFPISAAQFDSLCQELQMDLSGKINYSIFFSHLSGSKVSRICKKVQKIPDNLPIDEVELRVQEKIKNNLRDVIRSFWLFDINKDGLIQKTELRRIIRNYCFDLNDDLYNDLWKSYDPKSTGIINYRDFLIKLGISADRYKRYMPQEAASSTLAGCDPKSRSAAKERSCEQKCKRAALENRDDPAVQGLPLEEILIIFIDRLRRRYKLLKDVFKLFDSEKNGHISFSDFRGVINFFVLPMSSSLFNQVMKKLEIELPVENNLNYLVFLESYCKPDKEISSTRDSEKLDCIPVVQQIKNRVLNPEARLRAVFTKINADQEWQITRPELKKALEMGLDFKLTDEEFKDLTIILDPGNTNIINCTDFIRLFEGPCDSSCIRTEDVSSFDRKKNSEKYRNLSGEKLNSKLKHHLNKNLVNIEKAILVCDPDQSGFILPDKLQDILSGFCFPLTEDQFEDVVSGVRKYGDSINYHEFLKIFKKKPDEDTKKWIATVDKLVHYKSRCPPEIHITEAEEMLRDCIQFRKTAILNDFKSLDVCNVGVACKDDTRNILSKFAFRFTDEQFDELWKSFPRNKYNQLLYDKFFEEYATPVSHASETKAEEESSKMQDDRESQKDETQKDEKPSVRFSKRKVPKDIRLNGTAKSVENRKTSKEIFFSKAPQLKKIFESIEPTIVRNFRTIKFHLRRADPKVSDMVDFVILKSILAKSGIYFSKEDEFRILEYFDTRFTGKINYRDFLNIFVWYA